MRTRGLAVLHHKGNWQGHRSWLKPGLWVYCTIGRRSKNHEQSRRRHYRYNAAPRSARTLASANPAEEAKVAEAVPGCILLVEDNDKVGHFPGALLVALGHGVLRARNGEEGHQL